MIHGNSLCHMEVYATSWNPRPFWNTICHLIWQNCNSSAINTLPSLNQARPIWPRKIQVLNDHSSLTSLYLLLLLEWLKASLLVIQACPSLNKEQQQERLRNATTETEDILQTERNSWNHQLNNYLWIIFSSAIQNNLFLLIVLMLPHLLIQELLLWYLHIVVVYYWWILLGSSCRPLFMIYFWHKSCNWKRS